MYLLYCIVILIENNYLQSEQIQMVSNRRKLGEISKTDLFFGTAAKYSFFWYSIL